MELEKLERERNLHIREMKRLQSEDKSRYEHGNLRIDFTSEKNRPALKQNVFIVFKGRTKINPYGLKKVVKSLVIKIVNVVTVNCKLDVTVKI